MQLHAQSTSSITLEDSEITTFRDLMHKISKQIQKDNSRIGFQKSLYTEEEASMADKLSKAFNEYYGEPESEQM